LKYIIDYFWSSLALIDSLTLLDLFLQHGSSVAAYSHVWYCTVQWSANEFLNIWTDAEGQKQHRSRAIWTGSMWVIKLPSNDRLAFLWAIDYVCAWRSLCSHWYFDTDILRSTCPLGEHSSHAKVPWSWATTTIRV
jgi:hypothetical protein